MSTSLLSIICTGVNKNKVGESALWERQYGDMGGGQCVGDMGRGQCVGHGGGAVWGTWVCVWDMGRGSYTPGLLTGDGDIRLGFSSLRNNWYECKLEGWKQVPNSSTVYTPNSAPPPPHLVARLEDQRVVATHKIIKGQGQVVPLQEVVRWVI